MLGFNIYLLSFLQTNLAVIGFLCLGALSVNPVRVCVRPLSKFGVRSITFERLH